MTRQMLREIRVADKEEGIERIYKYFAEINDSPVVFHWKYHMSVFDLKEAMGLANYKSLTEGRCLCPLGHRHFSEESLPSNAKSCSVSTAAVLS